jgi:hypothetical protein
MKKKMTRNEVIGELMEISGFSYSGAVAFAEHLDDWEFYTGEELKFDPIAYRGKFDEFADFEEIQAKYPRIKDIKDLRSYTDIIEFNGGLIIGDLTLY